MMHPFSAAPHHDVLQLLVQLAVLLFTARALGEVAQRLGQPTVVGEILAGIVLGPSLLSGLFPAVGAWIVPNTPVQGYLLELISLFGVMFLLLITGLETDLALIRRQARSAIGVALGGLLVPLAFGYTLGQLLPEFLLNEPGDRLVLALFLAIGMAISAIPVIAKVLMDLKLTRRDIGQTIIAAAMIDDTVGWILLSVVIGLAAGNEVAWPAVTQSTVTVVGFLLLSLTVGRIVIGRLLRFVQNHLLMPDKVLSFTVLFMFIWGAIGHALGIEALLGAFIVGIVFSQIPQMSPDAVHKLESMSLGIFAPIFFAVAGLKVDVARLLTPELLLITALVIGVAVVCKLLGVYIGSRLIGKSDHWTAVFYGAALNARGSIGIIVANIGLSLGILSQDMFSVIVVMALVTSLMSPAVMRWAVRHIQVPEEEQKRLQREELQKESLLANVRRVLLPTRRRDEDSAPHLLEASVLQQLQENSGVALTLFTASTPEDYQASVDYLDWLADQFPLDNMTKKVVVSNDITNAILDEARMDYDLMILGAPEKADKTDALFTPMLDNLIHMSPCPTMLIQDQYLLKAWAPRRILVPSNGSQPARRAAEVAFALAASSDDAEVTVLQVVEENRLDYRLDASGAVVARQKQIAEASLDKLCELALLRGVTALPKVEVGTEPELLILQTVLNRHIDLIVMGTSIGIGSHQLYLGPRVERILSNAPCPVIILNT